MWFYQIYGDASCDKSERLKTQANLLALPQIPREEVPDEFAGRDIGFGPTVVASTHLIKKNIGARA